MSAATAASPPLATPKRRSKDDANPTQTPAPPSAPRTWAPSPDRVDGFGTGPKHRGAKGSSLNRSYTFDQYSCRERWEGGPSAAIGRFVRDKPTVDVPRGDAASMSPRRVTVRRFDKGELSWTERRSGPVAGALARAMKNNPLANAAEQPCRFGGGREGGVRRVRTEDLTPMQETSGDAFFFSQEPAGGTGGSRRATGDDWALATTRQGTTVPESEYSLPPIRTPGETWANYFARVPDAVAPGTEALLASERRKVGQAISKDQRESSLGAAEALGRQAELTAVRHNPDAALKRAALRADADLAREALLQGANPDARVKLGRRRRLDAREGEGGALAGGFDTEKDFESFLDDSLTTLMMEGQRAEEASRKRSNLVPVLHLLARRIGAVRSFTDTHVAAARGKARRNHYETGWTHVSIEDSWGDELWFACNLLDPTEEKIWARDETEAKRIAAEKEAEREMRKPREMVDIKTGLVKRQLRAAPTNYQESIPELMVLPIVRMLLELPTVNDDRTITDHRNAWRDQYGEGGKADVDAVDVNGNTALHEAARRGASGVIELLLQANAEVHMTNSQNQTAYDLAEDSQCKRLLLKTVKERNKVRKAMGSLRTLKNFTTRKAPATASTDAGKQVGSGWDDVVGYSAVVGNKLRRDNVGEFMPGDSISISSAHAGTGHWDEMHDYASAVGHTKAVERRQEELVASADADHAADPGPVDWGEMEVYAAVVGHDSLEKKKGKEQELEQLRLESEQESLDAELLHSGGYIR